VIFPGLHLLVTAAYGALLVIPGPVKQGLGDHCQYIARTRRAARIARTKAHRVHARRT
jgi:hypothetical protein